MIFQVHYKLRVSTGALSICAKGLVEEDSVFKLYMW